MAPYKSAIGEGRFALNRSDEFASIPAPFVAPMGFKGLKGGHHSIRSEFVPPAHHQLVA